MGMMRTIRQKITEDEHEICARIAEAVAQRRQMAGDEHGAHAACQVAKLIREDGIPEIRQTYRYAQRRKVRRVLQGGLLKVPGPLPGIIRLHGEGDSTSILCCRLETSQTFVNPHC